MPKRGSPCHEPSRHNQQVLSGVQYAHYRAWWTEDVLCDCRFSVCRRLHRHCSRRSVPLRQNGATSVRITTARNQSGWRSGRSVAITCRIGENSRASPSTPKVKPVRVAGYLLASLDLQVINEFVVLELSMIHRGTDQRLLQFRIVDLLLAPVAISVAAAAAVSIDLLAMDGADWVFGVGWPGRTREFFERNLPGFPKDWLVAAGAILALPSVVAVAVCNAGLGATVSRWGTQLAIFLPIAQLWATSWFLNGEFLWQLHGLHVLEIPACWLIAWWSYRLNYPKWDGRNTMLTVYRVICTLIMLLLVASSRFLYLSYVRSLEELFNLPTV